MNITDNLSKDIPRGYMGKILMVDLSKLSFSEQKLDSQLTELFFGGRGFGAYLLFEHFLNLKLTGKYNDPFREIDPLSGDNPLIFSTSPTTGTKMPSAARFHLNFKSPLTGGYGSSNSGGKWGVNLKRAGYDVLYITGRSEKPVFLVVSLGKVEFKSAEEFETLNSDEITDRILRDIPRGSSVLSIGRAGKNGSYYAAIINDYGRALGRGGAGAVCGAKKLFAIAVVPGKDMEIPVYDRESLDIRNESGAAFKAKIKIDVGKLTRSEKNFGFLSSMGSLGLLGMVNNYGQLIHNNMKDTTHNEDEVVKITGEALRNSYRNAKAGELRIRVRKGTCFNCPIACKRVTQVEDENGNIIDRGEGPEFETVTLLGANLSIYDLPTIAMANYLADRYGMDTISLGSTIAAFIEIFNFIKKKGEDASQKERQIFEDAKDFISKYGEPEFGKKEILIPLVKLIGEREGIGRYLALGSYRFCKRYGHEEFSMSVKGMELAAYDPRTSFSQALCYEMSNRGGCHLEGGYTAIKDYCAGYAEWPGDRVEGTPLISKNATLTNTVLDIIGACVYTSTSISLDEYSLIINAVTGLKYNAGILQRIALRTLVVERLFNNACGISGESDWLPERFYKEAVSAFRGKRVVLDKEVFERMHIDYYHAMGWDDHGKPRGDTLKSLGLEKYCKEMEITV